MTSGRRLRRFVARTIALVLVVLAAVLASPAPAQAHSGLAAASPGPGAVVGGEITEIQLFYGDIITEISGSVTDPEGRELDTDFNMLNEIEVTVELAEPLSTPGEYAVRHTVLSIDGDVVEAAYLFTYEPTAPPPQFIFLPESDEESDGGRSVWFWILLGGGSAIIAVLAARLLVSIRRRAVATAEPGATVDADA